MSEQEPAQIAATTQPKPVPEGYTKWNEYWTAQSMPWRTEPEIGEERQAYLAGRRAIEPDIEKGLYPFMGVKLARGDVEWLLATLESGGMRGPVDWSDENQRRREGIDLRGAMLAGVSLFALPLARLQGGIPPHLWSDIERESRYLSGVELQGTYLWGAHLEGADLALARMMDAHVEGAYLHDAYLREARLQGVNLRQAYLPGANLSGVWAEFSSLEGANLQGANLSGAQLQGADLRNAHLEGSDLSQSSLGGTDLRGTYLERANLARAHLEGNPRIPIVDTKRRSWQINAPIEAEKFLPPADLRGAFLDGSTALNEITLGDDKCGFVRVADVHWRDVNLAVVPWPTRIVLGDERTAWGRERVKQKNTTQREYSGNGTLQRVYEALTQEAFREAVRANRQLAAALRMQGLNENADQFAYRAQALQREVLRRQGHRGRALASWLLDAVAGYGYKPMRSVFTYIIVILGFAAAYFALTNFGITPFLPSHQSPLPWYESLVLSVSSFHGRGLFPTGLSLGDPIAILAAFEAIIGLLIEITFIATFTQRFFAR